MPLTADILPATSRPSLRGRMVTGLAALVCGQAIRTLGHLILVPLYLYYWSATQYGEWLALASLTAYLATLDLGVNTAGANRLTQEYARGDLAAYARYQASALAFYLGLATLGGLAIAVAAWRLPVAEWLGLRSVPPRDAAWVAWLLGVQILLAMPVGFLSAIYRTTGRLAWSVWLGNMQTLATFGLVPVVLALGGGMPALAGVQLIPLLAVAVFVIWHGWRRWPALMPRWSAARLSAFRDLVAPSLFFAIMLLTTALSLQGTVLLIVTQLGGVAVAVFVTSRTLTSVMRQVVFTFNNALWPHLTAMETTGDYRRLRLIHRLLVTGSSALSIAFAAALWHVGADVLSLWTGGKLVADEVLLRLLLVQLVLQAPWVASSILPLAFNRPRIVAYASVSSAVVGLVVGAMLIGRYGIAAVPIGLIVGEVLFCYVFVPREACRLIREDYRRFAVRQWLVHGAVMIGAFYAARLAAQMAMGPPALRWCEVGAAALIGSLLSTWTVGLTGRERALLVREGRALLARLPLVGVGAASLRERWE
jgi:O-antigen/teichoic acid export membrane protein